MTAHDWSRVLEWCAGMGYATLFAWAFAWLGMRDAIYRLHRRWFAIERSAYETLMFVLIGAFKLALMVFFLFPLIALHVSGVQDAAP